MFNNDDFEDLMKGNLEQLKDHEVKAFEINGESKLFPFWTPVKPAEVHYDATSYLDAKAKATRNKNNLVGVVKPKAEFKTEKKSMNDLQKNVFDTTLAGKISKEIEKVDQESIKDNTGIVQPVKNELNSTKTTKMVTEWDATKDNTVDTSKLPNHTPSVGDVKVLPNDMKATATNTQITEWDATKENKPVIEKSAKVGNTSVGAVKPLPNQLNDTKTTKMVTEWDATKENELEVDKAAKNVTPKVRMIKPKSTASIANIGPMNFDQYMVDRINDIKD